MIWEILFWNRLCGTVKAFYSRSLPVSVINERMAVLRGYGIKFAMDDFETGSSSSAMALEMLIDEIKIDMSFIRKILVNKKNKAIVQSMVDFANAANIKSCLEGVENKALEDYLRTVGATWFQGYYYSRPCPAEEFSKKYFNGKHKTGSYGCMKK